MSYNEDDEEYEKEEIERENKERLRKEWKLKRNITLTTKTDEEIIEMIFDKIKTQINLSYLNLNIYWNEIGVSIDGYNSVYDFPQSTQYRIEQIDNLVWQKVKILKKQRKHEETEKERKEAFKMIDEIIEWIKEKKLKKLSKIDLQLFLSEKKIDLIPINRHALYLEVNKEIIK